MLTHPNLNPPMWIPDANKASKSLLQQFINQLDLEGSTPIDYQKLHQWSLDNAEQFWERVWDFCGVIGSKQGPIATLGDAAWGALVPARDTIWFLKSRLNYAENLLAYGDKNGESLAIIFQNEQGCTAQLSWRELQDQVSQMQQWLIEVNVGEGDVVAGYLPHSPHAVIAMLAATSLGAIWTSTSPDFGAESVIERFGQVKPKVLFGVDGYQFGGKSFSMNEKNQPSVTRSIRSPIFARLAISIWVNRNL
ncbi:acetoacetyl-CoA synthetase [Vibrio variabilis]|uniref:Acetoacetyl-CoA synthetase n=1 Tax=Vibrio variabilis TaxID=990271 RepID=A0ABQ0JBE4_9VIBR|nr:acetoacetyl-CoA synthetase [Vibrio variabilis]